MYGGRGPLLHPATGDRLISFGKFVIVMRIKIYNMWVVKSLVGNY